MSTVAVRELALPGLAMVVIIVASNIAVQYPVEVAGLAEWLTWGAFTYPVSSLVTDLTNRRFGAERARRVIYLGFAVAVALSAALAGWRIALASGSAFLIAQLLDIAIFDRLRRAAWWRAPFLSSLFAAAVDTALFFSIAFAYTGLPWVSWGAGDFAVKVVMALVMLAPFRALMPIVRARIEVTRPA